jgi:hypothetical protein
LTYHLMLSFVCDRHSCCQPKVVHLFCFAFSFTTFSHAQPNSTTIRKHHTQLPCTGFIHSPSFTGIHSHINNSSSFTTFCSEIVFSLVRGHHVHASCSHHLTAIIDSFHSQSSHSHS